MGADFLDASALVKCWVQEDGTSEMRALLASPGALLYASTLTGAEVAAALERAARGERIERDAARRAVAELRAELREPINVVSLTAELMARAMDLAEAHALRGADAVQLATACEIDDIEAALGAGRIRLVAADGDLLAAAARQGLPTWNPETGPPPAS